MDMDKSPYANDNAAPPNPKTSIVAATTTFLLLLKSTWLWINIFKPFTDMKPYSNTEIPPKTGPGRQQSVNPARTCHTDNQ